MTGCGLLTDEELKEKPLVAIPDFEAEISRLSSSKTELIKKLTEDENTEIVRYTPDETGWTKELQAFIETDEFNVPGIVTKYKTDTTVLPVANLTRYRFTAISGKERVRKVTILTRDDQTIEVVFEVKNSTPVFSYEKHLTYRPRTGYRIESNLKIAGLINKSVVVQGVFNGPETPVMLHLDVDDEILSVQAFKRNNEFEIVNGSEHITLKVENGEAEFPVFNSKMFFDTYRELPSGKWVNYDRGSNYEIPFHCEFAFIQPTEKVEDYSGKYTVTFQNTGKNTPTVGVFDQSGNHLFGTFMTNTGDYRFLTGRVVGDSFRLSTFDGSFAYLFSGSFSEPGKIRGTYHSGNHYRAALTGQKDADAQLADSKKLTYLKESHDRLTLTAKNPAGEEISLDDERFQNKVVLITTMGSWCPNCKDESLYLEQLYQKYSRDDLEIVGLAFERKADFDFAKKSVEKMRRDLGLNFPVLLSGYEPTDAGKALPALNHVMSFPTLIVLDKNQRVVEIHTGFKGPATGEPYRAFTEEMDRLIEENVEK